MTFRLAGSPVPLRLLSYLAPSVPAALFEALATHLRTALDRDVETTFDSSRSGPRPGEPDPFRTGEVDLAFVCATSYVWLTSDRAAPAVELVGAAWAPTDPRSAGRAIYFGDVLAAAHGPRSLGALAGSRVAYNDDVSLSGYHSLRLALTAAGVDLDRVELIRSGSHLRSLEWLATGEVDAASIDSNVWRRRRREAPALAGELSVIAALGPHPVQPLVARSGLPPSVRNAARAALLAAHTDDAVAAAMAAAELDRFVAVSGAHYRFLRTQMDALAVTAPSPPDPGPPAEPAGRVRCPVDG